MNTKKITAEWMMLAPWLLALGYVGLVWHRLPARITTHYDLSGTPNGWMPKETALLLMSALGLVLYLFLRFLPRIDPKGRAQTPLFQRVRFVVNFLQAALLVTVFYMAARPSNGTTASMPMLAVLSLGIAALGNYITTIKPNWFIGIRTPWTLASDRVWTRTHRLGGRLLMTGGLLAALLTLLVPAPYTVGTVVTVLMIASLVPVVYSYVYFRQEKAHSPE